MKRAYIQLIVLSGFLMSPLSAYAAEHGADTGKKMLPALDVVLFPGVLFWMAVSFLSLLLVTHFFGIPGIKKTLGNRQDTLGRDLEEARKMGDKAQATVKAYEEGLHNARMSAHKTVSGIVAEAESEAAAQLESQAKEIKSRMNIAHDKIVKAKENAINEAKPFVSELVDEVYGQVLQSGLKQQVSGAGK